MWHMRLARAMWHSGSCRPDSVSLFEEGPKSWMAVQVVEQKGLDIVRRDWCPLSKDVGNFALQQILSGRAREEVVEAVHAKLREVRRMDCGTAQVWRGAEQRFGHMATALWSVG